MGDIFLMLAIIAADQLSKWWITANFHLYESREIIGGLFNLTFITNKGAAFGILGGDHAAWRQLFFVAAALLALSFIAWSYRDLRRRGGLYASALTMIAAGAAGNLIDRLRLGYVVDFLDFYVGHHHWPAFNIADSAITVGVLLFIGGQLLMGAPKGHI